jgi:hypothetical protein
MVGGHFVCCLFQRESEVMSGFGRLSAACATVLVATGLVVAPFLTGPASAAELLQDGGFEAATGNPPNSGNWDEWDSERGTPLCSRSLCPTSNQISPPRTGDKWAVFGTRNVANHSAGLIQNVTIPPGTATLTYWYRSAEVSSPFNATLAVQVDNTTLVTHRETSSPQSGYTQQTFNISQFANGASHRITFNYWNGDTSSQRLVVDDVSINHTPLVVTATPTVSSTVPASPSNSTTTPKVKGTAEAGSTVTLYSNSSCTSTALGSGSAADFAAGGITATVPANQTTTIRARATKSGQTASNCSSTSVAYTHDSTAPGLVTLTSITPTSPNPSTSPVVKGTAEGGSTVRLYTTSGCTGTPAATGTAAAFAGAGLTVAVAAGSTTTFKATATDAAGNTSNCSSSSLTYVNDSTAPGVVTLTSTTPGSPGPSTTPQVKGTAEAGATVRVYATAGCTGSPAATGTAAAFASPGLTVTVAAGSTTTFRATATDAAGNASACSTSSLTYVQDSVAPTQVVLTSVTPASPNTSTAPVVKGTAEAGSTVRLYPTAGCTGTPAATGTAAAFAAPGLTVTVLLGSTTTFKATATDSAGNVSACSSSSLTYTSDLLDGSFEAATGNPADSPVWAEADSLAGSPLCTVATCTPGPEISPRTGSAWAWFGGFAEAGHTGSLAQVVTLPVGSVALTYWYRNSSVTAPFDAVLLVQVDGTTVRTHTEASVAEPAYTKQTVDLSPFADGGSHILSFSYANGGAGVNNIVLDDVGLSPGSAPHTATPTVAATSPASPSTSTTPKVTGTAEAGSTVTLHSNSTCKSAALGAGSAAEFAAAGITATVPAETATTRIYARAFKAGQNDSACSTTFVAYSHLGPPDTTLVKTPKKTVPSRKRKQSVVFAFSSATAGAVFECSVDGKAFRACSSGRKVKLKVGKHTFAVRAVAAGLVDATPATYSFRIKRKR